MAELWMKDKKVLSFKEENGAVVGFGKVEDASRVPLCLVNECTIDTFNTWLNKRGIPENREGLREMQTAFGTKWLYSKNRLSLSDQYWVRYRMEEWRKINFFTNKYSHDIGDIAFSPWNFRKHKIDSNSPDLTTNGILKKRWRQNEKKQSILIKSGSKITHQEPLSEVLVTVLLEQLEIVPFVPYELCVEGVTLCSRCENFITKDTELIPVSYIYHLKPRTEKETVYDHILAMCDEYDVPGMQKFLNAMIYIDAITGNDDRNLGNIGLIRDVNTLKFLGPAPLFDFGAAYWSGGKIDAACRSKRFHDVEKKIVKQMRKNTNVDAILKNDGFIHCIDTYPGISPDRKDTLKKAIKERNRALFMERGRECIEQEW